MKNAELRQELETATVNAQILEELLDDLVQKQTLNSLKAIQKVFQFNIKAFSKLKKADMLTAITEEATAQLTVVYDQITLLKQHLAELPKVAHKFSEMITEKVTRKKAVGFGS